jgi:hypothetical protein
MKVVISSFLFSFVKLGAKEKSRTFHPTSIEEGLPQATPRADSLNNQWLSHQNKRAYFLSPDAALKAPNFESSLSLFNKRKLTTINRHIF